MTTLQELLKQWEARSKDALPTDAMLINKHIRELRTALAQQGYKPSCLHGDDDYCKACYMQEATAASPEVIPVRTNIKNQIFMDISSPQPLTYDDLTAIVQCVVGNSERLIGMVAYGVLVARAIERAHGIGGAP